MSSWGGGWGGAPPTATARPAWTDTRTTEVDQADDEEELTTDDEKDKVSRNVRPTTQMVPGVPDPGCFSRDPNFFLSRTRIFSILDPIFFHPGSLI